MAAQYKCEQDKSVLYMVAKGLMEMQIYGGIIPEIKGKGTAAKNVADMMVKLRKELGEDGEDNTKESEISELILIDRGLSSSLAAANLHFLCSQLTLRAQRWTWSRRCSRS